MSAVNFDKYRIEFNEKTGEVTLCRNSEIWEESPLYSKLFVSIIYNTEKLKAENEALKEKLKKYEACAKDTTTGTVPKEYMISSMGDDLRACEDIICDPGKEINFPERSFIRVKEI